MPIIIAEAGVNHNGDLGRALRMAEAARDAGADYIKFQTFKSEQLVTPGGKTAEYQKTNCDADSQLEMLRALEISYEDFRTIAAYCKELGIGFLSTPFDSESVGFLAELGMDFMKVPSGEITNLPYLRRVAKTGIPALISTGMCEISDIEKALEVFYGEGYTRDNLTLLHCNTEYPTPMRDVNLRAMRAMGERFGLPTGYSDHTKGIEVPVAATALGAVVIEKHFTLDRTLPGPDHVASLEPDELAAMARAIRNITEALGSPEKHVTDSERANREVARRSIVTARDIKAGETFTEMNLTTKRPGTGLSPIDWWDRIIGTKATADLSKDTILSLSDSTLIP